MKTRVESITAALLHVALLLPAFALFLSLTPEAAAQDLCAGLVTDKSPHPMTSLAKPAVGQAVTDPQFGTAIRRISAAPAGGVIKPMYSTISAWNADESRLILYRVGSGHQLYDGKSYQLIRTLDISPADIEQVYWDTTNPDLLYYVNGNAFIRYHVSSAVKDTLTSFSFCSSASGGGDPMFTSWDSRRIGLQCGSDRFIYDISTNIVIGRKTMNTGAPQVSPTGTLAFFDGKVSDAALNVVRTLDLGNPAEHASLGKLASGHDTYNGVAFDPGPGGSDVGSLVTFDMTDGSWRVVVGPATGYPYPPSGTHVSAMAYKRPGWVSLSIVGNTSGSGVLDNEIVLADTNAGGKVCRVAHHRSWGGNGSLGYWAEPHAVPSPSGTRILFGSDWGNSGSVDAFVVELPGYGVSRDGDLSLALAASPNPAAQGSLITYTASVRNGGSTTISSATLTDTLPAGVGFVSASAGCGASAGTVTCAVGSLAAGATTNVSITVSADSVGSALDQASVTGSVADPDSSNNSASVTTAIVPTVSIGDATLSEGDSGTKTAQFTVSLSSGSTSTVTVAYATANGSAAAGSDYVAASGTLSFSAGSVQRTLSVTVNGDTTYEPNETFLVNLTSPTNAVLADAQGQGTITNDDPTAPPPAAPVVWTSAVGVTVNGNSLTKTTATGTSAGAVSTQQIVSGSGYVEFTASETTTSRMLGLSNGNTDTSSADVDFGLQLSSGAVVNVFEKGINRGSFGRYKKGQVFRVAVAGGVVKYSRNGVVFYTSGQAPVYPLLVDTWLNTQGATIKNAMISGGQ